VNQSILENKCSKIQHRYHLHTMGRY